MTRFSIRAAALAALVLAAAPLRAQHSHSMPADTSHAMPGMADHGAMGHGAMPGMAHGAMTSAVDPAAPMTADASGTSRIPAASPLEATMTTAGGWHLMLHGAAFPRLTAVDAFNAGSRGGTALGVPNWLMGMAQRPVGPARLTLRAMVSADPITESADGYRLLFQSGETAGGARLVDRQHPHDAVSELSATVSAPVSQGVAAFGYVGYPGEPALGPAAFMHRPSARFLPDAPIAHHWQDATHIAWGVATAGIAAGPLTVDASLFTGREPDENRWAPDRPRFDSYSARIAFSPSPRWAFQVSRGFIREPEALELGVDQWRTTASALYAMPTPTGDVTATLAWGLNEFRSDGHHGSSPQQAVLAEVALRRGRLALFSRGEVVRKSGEELALTGDLGEGLFTIGEVGLGAGVDVARRGGAVAMLGGQVTGYGVPEALRPLYGRVPVSAQVFLRITPAAMR